MTPKPSISHELKRLWQLGAPMALAQLGAMMLNVVDTIMVGELGVFEFDAAALGNIWIFGTSIFAIGLLLGADPILTQAHGARRPREVAVALQRSLVLSLVASIPVALAWIYVEPVLLMAGQDAGHAGAAAEYLAVQVSTIPAYLAYHALRQYLQARGIVGPGMWVALVANLFNIVANWALIWGHLGFEPMGLEGAGIATATTRGFLFLGLLAWVWAAGLHRDAWIPWSAAAFDPRGLGQIAMLGAPIAIQYGLEGWAFQISGLMAGLLGPEALAAHTAVLSLASLSFMLALGISVGATTRIGNLIGAGRHESAQRAAYVALAMGSGAMAVAGLAFVAFRHALPALYIDDPAVIALAAGILPIAAAFQIMDGAQVVGGGVLRGMGRTRPAAVFNFIAYYLVALPVGWLLGLQWGWGLAGLWTALALGLGLVALALVVWIRHRGPRSLAGESRVVGHADGPPDAD